MPHYPESDPVLGEKLQSQHELVTGGVVLGQTPTVPEDTRALLRQLLTARDRQGVLAQVQANLGSVGTLIAALLALFGLAAAARITALIVLPSLERKEQNGGSAPPTDKKIFDRARETIEKAFDRAKEKIGKAFDRAKEIIVPRIEKSDWLTNLADNQEVTVWLRSGRRVTGVIVEQFPPNGRDATAFRIKNTHPVPDGPAPPQQVSWPEPKGRYVLVAVKEIELIDSWEAATVTNETPA